MYHWLGLQFRSPFINLFMCNDDFLSALEDLENFIASPIEEVKDSGKKYPVGRGLHKGELIYFMHYNSFDSALEKWNERILRIDFNNLVVMHTNWPGENGGGRVDDITRYDNLKFKNKVIFTDKEYSFKSAFHLKGLGRDNDSNKQAYATANYLTGKRYIDQFDYIQFFNNANTCNHSV